MVIGNLLVTSLDFVDSTWKYYTYIFPANLGQGIVYPGILFTSLATFDHAGKDYSSDLSLVILENNYRIANLALFQTTPSQLRPFTLLDLLVQYGGLLPLRQLCRLH